jgi:NADPH-dependent 2,4-dienoyl-CoA reductase/sulfur reductase-like enzyme
MSSPEPDPRHVVVVGGSTGAVRTVQALRKAGYAGRLTMVSDEAHLPYDRPPLSKELLGADHDGSPVALLTAEQAADLAVEVRTSTRATRLEPVARRLTVASPQGEDVLGYDAVVIATGAAARRLPGADGITGVHVIRDLDDVTALRDELGPGRRAVVVGAGFIGAEFAAAAHAHDMVVTLVEAEDAPLVHVLGTEVGTEVASVHAAHGARLRLGCTVARLCEDGGRVSGVVLGDGEVVGIGAVPNTQWLSGSGLPVGDGVECTEDLQVVGFPGVYAVGDVARWPHPSYAEPIRVEHWTNAGDHAEIVAAHLTGRDRPRPAVPHVWSDQYGHRLQIVGRPGAGVLREATGSMKGGDLVATYVSADGALVGALVVDDPRTFLALRKEIRASAATTKESPYG